MFVNFYSLNHRIPHKKKNAFSQIREWISLGRPRPMCTARPQWQTITLQRITYKSRLHQVRLDLPDVVSVDEERRLVRVEPMVTIGQLNDFLVL